MKVVFTRQRVVGRDAEKWLPEILDVDAAANEFAERAVDRVVAEVFDENLYNENEGGLLGGLGQLFKNRSCLYAYPSLDFATGEVVTVENLPVAPHLRYLYRHLTENRFLRGLADVDVSLLRIRARDVLDKIAAGDGSWEQLVPPAIADVITREKLFGWRARQETT